MEDREAGALLIEIARRHGWDPVAIYQVIEHESGWEPSNRNPTSGASGLIQWIPSNIPDAYTPEQFRGLSRVEQLRYVEEWFFRWLRKGEARRGAYYAVVYLPGRYRSGKDPISWLGDGYYKSNPSLDVDGDGKITLADLESVMDRYTPPDWFLDLAGRKKKSPPIPYRVSSIRSSGRSGLGLGRGLMIGIPIATLTWLGLGLIAVRNRR